MIGIWQLGESLTGKPLDGVAECAFPAPAYLRGFPIGERLRFDRPAHRLVFAAADARAAAGHAPIRSRCSSRASSASASWRASSTRACRRASATALVAHGDASPSVVEIAKRAAHVAAHAEAQARRARHDVLDDPRRPAPPARAAPARQPHALDRRDRGASSATASCRTSRAHFASGRGTRRSRIERGRIDEGVRLLPPRRRHVCDRDHLQLHARDGLDPRDVRHGAVRRSRRPWRRLGHPQARGARGDAQDARHPRCGRDRGLCDISLRRARSRVAAQPDPLPACRRS